jgi:Transglutaminase-like superfamily
VVIPRLWIFALAGTLAAQAPVADPDRDGDGLSDFHEIHKHLTDPGKKDSDGDGVPDGDWNERREWAYTVRTVVFVMRPADVAAMNDDYQDARFLEETADWVKAEVVHYPFGTAAQAIVANPKWRAESAAMRSWLESTTTSNWDEKTRAGLLAKLGDVAALDDKAFVEKAAPAALNHAKVVDGFTTFYTSFEGKRPFVMPELRAKFDEESRKAGRKMEDVWAHELFAKGMFENATRGTCTSSAIYLCGCLRALGVPTRIVLCIPCVDSNDAAELEMVRKNVKHAAVRRTMLAALEKSKGWSSHTFNEVWVGGRWRRLNYERLGQPILDENYLGLMTHVATLRDWADGKAASTIGKRHAKGDWKEPFTTANPYSVSTIEDRFGAHCKVPNPSGPPRELTIDAVMWSDEAKLAGQAGRGGLALLGRVRGWKEWDPFKMFTQDADGRFYLEAEGQPSLGMETGTGGVTMTDGSIWILLPLGPADLDALRPGVAYTLRPRNDKPPLRWSVADGLKVVRK